MTEGDDSGMIEMVEILPGSLRSGPQTTRASGRDDKVGDSLPRWGRAVLDPYFAARLRRRALHKQEKPSGYLRKERAEVRGAKSSCSTISERMWPSRMWHS